MKGKKSFTAYCDWIETFDELTDEEAGKLVKHLFRYVNDQNPDAPDRVTKLLFAPIKATLKRDLQKWLNRVEANRDNGLKGGRPKKQNNPKKPNGLSQKPNNPTKGDRDSVRDRDRDSVSVSDKEVNTRPSDFTEFKNYAIDKAEQKNLNLDLTKLELKFDSWKEAGWINGNGKRIKNWKSTLLNTLPYLQKEKSSAKKESQMDKLSRIR